VSANSSMYRYETLTVNNNTEGTAVVESGYVSGIVRHCGQSQRENGVGRDVADQDDGRSRVVSDVRIFPLDTCILAQASRVLLHVGRASARELWTLHVCMKQDLPRSVARHICHLSKRQIYLSHTVY
jgi:hypothetical protein